MVVAAKKPNEPISIVKKIFSKKKTNSSKQYCISVAGYPLFYPIKKQLLESQRAPNKKAKDPLSLNKARLTDSEYINRRRSFYNKCTTTTTL